MAPMAGNSPGKKGLSKEPGKEKELISKRQINNRRGTLFKKAKELCILCECKICALITDEEGNVETWTHETDDALQLIKDYQKHKHSARKSSVPRKMKSTGGGEKANNVGAAGNRPTALMIGIDPQVTIQGSSSSPSSGGAAMADGKSGTRQEYCSGYVPGVTNAAYYYGDSGGKDYGPGTRFFGEGGNTNETLAMIEYELSQFEEGSTSYNVTVLDEVQGFLGNDEGEIRLMIDELRSCLV